MKQYLITGYDSKGSDALERRMKVRPNHLGSAKTLKEKGNFIMGGAILDADGKMIGSMMVMQFENDEDRETWTRTEPYITEKVWERYEIKPFKVADV
jgi:uncharacterized protein YciI